jgi:hypothetical protein
MSLTKLSLGGNNDVIYKLFPPRESLVSDIPAGDGNIEKLFLRCRDCSVLKAGISVILPTEHYYFDLAPPSLSYAELLHIVFNEIPSAESEHF